MSVAVRRLLIGRLSKEKEASGNGRRADHSTVAAEAGEAGAALQGAVSVGPGVWMYQLTDTVLAPDLTGKGTR